LILFCFGISFHSHFVAIAQLDRLLLVVLVVLVVQFQNLLDQLAGLVVVLVVSFEGALELVLLVLVLLL
jgi:hypothetical protein